MPGSVIAYVDSAPEMEMTSAGDAILTIKSGGQPFVFLMPRTIFQSAVYRGLALIKRRDEKEQAEATPVPLYAGDGPRKQRRSGNGK
jgi:hypothetical protein